MSSGPIPVLHSIESLRAYLDAAREHGKSIGCVMTMGALHAGHASLIDAAAAAHDEVVVTVFVNPTQFGPNEDLAAYPRTLDDDVALAAHHSATVVFTPTVEEMYPGGIGTSHTTVHVARVSERLCGASRPGHFDGVSTVVTKLLNIIGPCTAYFGKKDAQQLAVIRALVTDLDLRVEVIACPILRESDGLALSSRNRYLDPEERRAAAGISRALFECADRIGAGQRDAPSLRAALVAALDAIPGGRLDYAEFVDARTFQPIDSIQSDSVLAVAVHFGGARLIDNIHIGVQGSTVDIDRGRFLPAQEP